MKLFKKLMSKQAKEAQGQASEEIDLETEIKAMKDSEDAAARADQNSGLVAIYPELGASRRRRRRGFVEMDFDEYVPELDDYEPGKEGKYLSEDDADDMEDADVEVPGLVRTSREPSVQPVTAAPAGEPPRDARSVPMAARSAAVSPSESEAPKRPPVVDVSSAMPDPAPRVRRPVVDMSEAGKRISEAVRPAPEDDDEGDRPRSLIEVPEPSSGAANGRRAGRVKTRLLGFNGGMNAEPDPFESAEKAAASEDLRYPVGWIVVVEGPGRGASFTLRTGASTIGRGEDQSIRLDFGDTSISRSSHAMVAYDGEQRKFYLGHGGKANLVRLNGKPVLSTEDLSSGDKIRIGETTLWFIALCGAEFDWKAEDGAEGIGAAIA